MVHVALAPVEATTFKSSVIGWEGAKADAAARSKFPVRPRAKRIRNVAFGSMIEEGAFPVAWLPL